MRYPMHLLRPPPALFQRLFIANAFEIYSDLLMCGNEAWARIFYSWLPEDKCAQVCIECGECLFKCPQGIEILE